MTYEVVDPIFERRSAFLNWVTAMDDKSFEIERKGALDGLNPMFGEWRKKFNFEPVPHSNPGALRRAFQERLQSEIQTKFLYTGDVKLTITLYLDLQLVIETSETADVDNYAKSICDALKGPDGIIIDDTQVQSLTISWIDSPVTYFEVEFSSTPDAFTLKPAQFYEMPDGLFYSISRSAWSVDGPKAVDDIAFIMLLLALEEATGSKRRIRHALRQGGQSQTHAFQIGMYFTPIAIGFHKSRIAASGFKMQSLREWQEYVRTWKAKNPGVLDEFEAMLAKRRESALAVADEFRSWTATRS